MKSTFLIFLISLLSFLSVSAQRTDLIYSAEKLPEKETSKYKLEILTNGNTANIGLNESVGFFCTLYDANKKTIAHTIVPTTFQVETVIMKSVFEINNEVVVFIVSSNKNAPVLSRYIFDGSTGKLKKEDVILIKVAWKTVMMVSEAEINYIIPSEFFIQKDPNSNYYAISYFDFQAPDINKRIEVIHFSPTHEIITRAYFTNPESNYLKLHYVTMYVNGPKSVILSSFLYNTKLDKGKEEAACFYLSELKAGATNFKSVKAVETDYYHRAEAIFVFNGVTNKILLLSTIYSKGEKGKIGGYNVISQTLNLETLALTELINLHSEKLDAAYMAANSTKEHYKGFPQHYCINSKGNAVILSEYISLIGGYTLAQKIGINCLTPEGQDIYGTTLHYMNSQGTKAISFMYTKGLNGQYTYSNYFDEFQDTYVGLVSGKSNSYLFLNNTVERFKMLENNVTPTFATAISSNKPKFTSFIYTLNDVGIASKEYIFGKPVSEDVTKYCRFNTADYDPATGLYAVIVVDKIKGKKTISVLWMNLK